MIVFDAVTKRYPGAPGAGPGEPAPAAVDSFSATIERGSVTVLLGSSGCGKTTLLRMVNRMVEPTAGRVLVDGQDVAATDPVAVVLLDLGLAHLDRTFEYAVPADLDAAYARFVTGEWTIVVVGDASAYADQVRALGRGLVTVVPN